MTNIYKFLSISLLSLCALSISAKQPLQRNVVTQKVTPPQKIATVESIIENYYVDSVDGEKLAEEGIRAMLRTLDPHSTYSNAEETKELTTPLEGNFSGIGIQFNMLNDTLYVIQTTVGGPSEKVGLQPGDRIISANDSILSGVGRKNNDILKILRGPKGTQVMVKVLRKNEPKPLTFKIIRDDIPLYSVDAAYAVNDSTGYIKVSRFATTTANEVKEALEKFKKNGIKDVIIDLEDNGGGYLDAAVDMASLFLPKGSLVVYTEGPKVGRTDYKVTSNPIWENGRLIVLVNQNSASSSEIFSGAIQDYDRGVIIGRRTFGKGLVQRPFPFPDGSMVRLTVSKYYTPSGRSIQKPYEKGEAQDYYMDIYNRYQHGEFTNADSIHFDDSLKTKTLRNKRTVYGGGGIMPDVFVPLDTVGNTKYYRELLANGLFNSFVINYIDNNRDRLRKVYPTPGLFVKEFEISDNILKEFVNHASKAGVEPIEEQLEESKPLILTILKGLMGRDLWDMDTYFMITNPEIRPTFNEALDILSSPEKYDSILEGKETVNEKTVIEENKLQYALIPLYGVNQIV